jgi:archaellum component FlaC
LGLSSLFVPNVRLALTEDIALIKARSLEMQRDYEKALVEDQELRNQVAFLESERADLENRKQQMELDQKNAIREVELLRQEKLKIDAELAQNVIEENILRDQLTAREKELDQYLEAVEDRNRQIQATKTQLEGLETELKSSRQELEVLSMRLASMRDEALKAIETIAELSEIINQKETRRIVIHHMEPLVEYPLQISVRPPKDEFLVAFEGLLTQIRNQMNAIGIEPYFLESQEMQNFAVQVEERVQILWDKIEAARKNGADTARGVLIYPISEHNVFAGERLEEARFLVIEDRLLIPSGVEIYRMTVETQTPAEELLKIIFERDEHIKKLMFSQGVLGNPFKPRTPKQIIQFARFVHALNQEKPQAVLSIVTDDDIYASGNFAFRYNIIHAAPQD